MSDVSEDEAGDSGSPVREVRVCNNIILFIRSKIKLYCYSKTIIEPSVLLSI